MRSVWSVGDRELHLRHVETVGECGAVTDRLPTLDEQAFLVKLAYLLGERRGFGLSFEL